MPQAIPAGVYYLAQYFGTSALVASAFAAAAAYGVNRQQTLAASRRAKAAYNDGLKDRLVSQATVDGARSRVYGSVRTTDGILFKATRGDKSQFYTLLIGLAGHEVEGIDTVYFNDEPVNLDGNGYVTTAPWSGEKSSPTGLLRAPRVTAQADIALVGGSGSVTLPNTPFSPDTVAVTVNGQVVPHSLSGATVTVTGAGGFTGTGRVTYQFGLGSSTATKARVRKYLGAPGQDLSASLGADFPGLITSAHRFAGIALLRVDLEYDQDAYPTGVPNITAVVRGAKVYDPRTGVTAWTNNSALCARDWVLYPQGCGASVADIDDASFIAAASACDVVQSFTVVDQHGGTVTTAMPTYTCGLAARTDADPLQTLDQLVASMAGRRAFCGGVLRVRAGAYRAPVATITESWISDKGDIDIVSSLPRTELFNVVKATIADAAQKYVPVPMNDIRAAAYIEADGIELPLDLTLSAVTSAPHAQHICGVLLRESRQAVTLRLPCNNRAFPLEVFDCVRVTLPRFGFEAKLFEVLSWEFSVEGGVGLTLRETDASVFELDAEFTTSDPAPNTALPSPFGVRELVLNEPASGTEQLLRQSDGTVVSRILVSWPAIQDEPVRNGGAVDIQFGPLSSPLTSWQTITVPGSDVQAYLAGVQDGAWYGIQARARNKLTAGSWSALKWHRVQGKSAAPGAVQGLAAAVVPGAVRISRTPSTELDYDFTIYRYGSTFASGTQVPGTSDERGTLWAWPSPGTYTIWAADVDTSGNIGTPASVGPIVVTAGALSPASSALSIKLNVNDFAGSTNYNEAYIHGRDAAGNAVDQPGTIMVNGRATEVPNGNLYTNLGPVAGYIVWDSAGATFSTGVGLRPYVMARRYQGAWQYDDNSAGWVNFTPASTHYVIGTLESGGPDAGNPGSPPGFTAASIWAAASTLNSLEAAADDAYTLAAAQSTITLINDGGMTIAGNTVTKTGGSGGSWDAAVRSRDSYTGGAFVSWVVTSIVHSHGLGLNTDPTTNASYDTIDAWMYVEAGTQNLYAFNNGTAQNLGNPIGTYNVGDVLAVTYDGSVFRYYRNGAVQFSQAATVTSPLFLDSSFNTAGTKVTNIQFGPLTSNAWTSIGGRPASYRVAAQGLSSSGAPLGAGLIDADTNAGLLGAAGMYRVAKINRSSKMLTDLGGYSPLSGGLSQCNAMAAALNSIDSSHICVVYTYDEPQGNRMLGDLPAAMYRNGASRAVWGSSAFRYRAAYILVGIGGCGEGNGAECYAGAVDSDANAWCDTTFQITANGALIVSGASRGATTLLDYGYTGDLAATQNQTYYQDTDPTVSPGGVVDGAIWVTSTKSWQRYGGVWRPYVGAGSVDTNELVPGAATTLAEVIVGSVLVTGTSFTGGPNSYAASFNLLGTVTFTPKVTGIANLYISAALTASETFTKTVAATARHFIKINVDQDDDGVAEAGDEISIIELQQYIAAGFKLSWSGPVAGRVQVATVAGVPRTLKVYGQQIGDAPATYTLTNLRLGVEGINR